jgi:tRNA A37 threonylcarbamoyladenosine dehydratase
MSDGLRAIDGNGHVPDQDSPDTESFNRQLASTREAFAKAQADLMRNAIEIAHELGRLRGQLEERNRERM